MISKYTIIFSQSQESRLLSSTTTNSSTIAFILNNNYTTDQIIQLMVSSTQPSASVINIINNMISIGAIVFRSLSQVSLLLSSGFVKQSNIISILKYKYSVSQLTQLLASSPPPSTLAKSILNGMLYNEKGRIEKEIIRWG